MKKTILLILAALCFLLTSCSDTSSAQDSKSDLESRIIADLSENINFWNLIFGPGTTAPELYEITSFEVLSEEISDDWGRIDAISEEYLGTVTLKSDYATYTGNISLQYVMSDEHKLELSHISQTVNGTFEIVGLPDQSLLEDKFHSKYDSAQSYEDNPIHYELLHAEATAISDAPTLCEVTFTYQYEDGPYCTVTQTDFELWECLYGIWRDRQPSRDSVYEYDYHNLPPVTETQISNIVSNLIPEEIGTYTPDSAILQQIDSTHIQLVSCEISSANTLLYDTSDLSIESSFFWTGEGWGASETQCKGDLKLSFSGTYTVPNSLSNPEAEGEPANAEITISAVANLDEYDNIVVPDVTVKYDDKQITRDFYLRAVNGDTDLEVKTNSKYLLYKPDTGDNTASWYFYFDANLKPTCFSKLW